jgi:hypothetical protein
MYTHTHTHTHTHTPFNKECHRNATLKSMKRMFEILIMSYLHMAILNMGFNSANMVLKFIISTYRIGIGNKLHPGITIFFFWWI